MSRSLVGALPWFAALLVFAVPAGRAGVAAKPFTDHFTKTINPSVWNVKKTEAIYAVSTSHGAVRVSTPGGGAGGFQWAGLQYRHRIAGNFDVSVRYSNASIKRVNGSPGNQIQLNATFGGQTFCLVRSDESDVGDNYHVWINSFVGSRPSKAKSGVLRIVRVGSTVTGYANGVKIYQGTFNPSPVTDLWFSIQNNGTTDPISVTFDDFTLRADSIS